MNPARLLSEEISYHLASGWSRLTLQVPRAKVLVNGSPKTGTTWMVKMLACLPGFRAVGNFQGDLERYRHLAPGDVVHGHHIYTPALEAVLVSEGVRVVLMSRDPRDQTVSRYFHIRRDSHHRWHGRMNRMEKAEGLLACLEGREGLPGSLDMVHVTRSWEPALEAGWAILVRYEDLVQETHTELRRVLKFLGLEAPDRLVEAIVRRNAFARLTVGRRFWQRPRRPGEEDPRSHFRKGIVGDWRSHFEAMHVQRCKAILGEVLVELGYETNQDW